MIYGRAFLIKHTLAAVWGARMAGAHAQGMAGGRIRVKVEEENPLEDYTMAYVSMKQMLETGVHFGHQTRRWNPKMRPYIFGARNGIHIIDLQQTVKLFRTAYDKVVDTVANGGKVLFVGTKRQAQEAVAAEASRAGQYYVTNRARDLLLS